MASPGVVKSTGDININMFLLHSLKVTNNMNTVVGLDETVTDVFFLKEISDILYLQNLNLLLFPENKKPTRGTENHYKLHLTQIKKV